MSLPYARGSETSRAAAQSTEGRTFARRIWRLYVDMGCKGFTADELVHFIIVQLGVKTKQSTITARLVALKYSGLIVRPDGKPTRITSSSRKAAVWVANPNLDFDTAYQEPPSKHSKGESLVLNAARDYAHNPTQANLDSLISESLRVYKSGEAPAPTPDDSDFFEECV